MNINKQYLYLLVLAGIVLTSCVKRDLEMRPQKGFVEITLDWKQHILPSEVCYLFYNHSGNLVKEVLGSPKGIVEHLPAGTYHLLLYSRDAKQVDYQGLNMHNTAEVFVHAEEADAENTTNGTHILQPQQVFGESSCQSVGELVVEQGKILRRTVEPKQQNRLVKFLFTVKNVTEVEELHGVLNGVAPSMILSTGKSNFTRVASTSFIGVEEEKNTRTSNVNVLDLLSSNQSLPQTNMIDVYLKVDNKQYNFTTDLTQVLLNIIESNEGVLPLKLFIEIEITLKDTELSATAIVKPWVDGGTSDETVE